MPEDGAASGGRETPRPARRAVVLGGTGLIGASVVRELLDGGVGVTALARRAPDPPTAALLDGAQVVEGDASDRGLLEGLVDGADLVVDALGAPHPADSARDPVAQFDAEVPVLLGVLEVLARTPAVAFTYLSSGGAIYGDAAALPVREDAACNPVSPYGVTKLAAERYVLSAAHRGGLRARVLRVANAYGARQRPGTGQGLVAVLLRASMTGEAVQVFGDGAAVRDYVDVRDVAQAVAALASLDGERGDDTQVLNVGSGTGHTVNDVVSIVEQVTGATIEVRHMPPRDSDVRAVVLDVARLAATIEWAPRPLADGVADAWRAWATWVPTSRPERPVRT